MEEISIREAARRLNVTHPAILKRIAAGTLSTLANGKLDWSQVEQQYTGNRDESKVRKPDPPMTAVPQSAPSARNYSDAKTKREYVRLEREAIDLKRLKGEMASIAEINAFVAGMIIRAREVLTRMGPELKDRMAQETDPHKCERLIVMETTRALNELAEFTPNS